MSLPAPDPNATILVTGASSGIGTELARQLARKGHGVTLVARRREPLDALAGEIRDAHGVAVDVRPADLGDAAAREELVGALRSAGRFVSGLCNNAGFGSFGFFGRMDQDHERQEVRVNVVALHELTGAFLPAMVEHGGGAICNIGSTAGNQPIPGQATYSATKAFVNTFSEALHAELAGTGVSCTVVTPGPVKTEFFDRMGQGELEHGTPAMFWETAERVARDAIDGMEKGRRVVAPGFPAKAMSMGGRFTPRTALLPAMRAGVRSRW